MWVYTTGVGVQEGYFENIAFLKTFYNTFYIRHDKTGSITISSKIAVGLHGGVLKNVPFCKTVFGICTKRYRKIGSTTISSGITVGVSLAIWLLLFKQRRMQFKPIERRLIC